MSNDIYQYISAIYQLPVIVILFNP